MKKLALLLLLSLCLSSFAGEELDYYTGAYTTTTAPTRADREAGMLRLYFWDDGSCDLDLYYDGVKVFTAVGWSTVTRTATKVEATYANANGVYLFKGVYRSGLITGTWSVKKGTRRIYSGKWQATFAYNVSPK